MDRNQAIGLMLMAALLLVYFQFFSPKPTPGEEIASQEQVAEKQSEPVEPAQEETSMLPDSLQDIMARERLGRFSAGAKGTEEIVTLGNSNLEVEFSSKGGLISSVRLKDFTTYHGEPLYLITPSSSRMYQKAMANGRQVNLHELFYESRQWVENDTSYLSFTIPLAGNGSVEHRYSLPPEGYEIGYKLNTEGISFDDGVDVNWRDNLIIQEKDINLSRTNSTVNYLTVSGDFDGLTERSTTLEEESIDEPVKWIAIKQRFFVSSVIADDHFTKGKISAVADPADSSIVKETEVNFSLEGEGSRGLTYYFGPNDYHITKHVAEDFSKNLYLGWPPMIWVNKFIIIPLFDLLNNFISNYGLIIVIMVLLIKLALSPLSYKSYLSMAKMKVLKPEMDAIKEKHGDDMAAAQQETMKLYQQVGVNPVSGCVPMALQMPILFAMFYFFPQSIELRGKPFLWAEDLSTYDSVLQLPFTIPFYGDHVSLFVLLMTVSTILWTWSNQQVSTVQGPMKAISYMMPVIFLFVLNSYPAALSFYYFVSNLVTFGQQIVIRKFVDDDKIRKILEENKKSAGSRKKSKFQQRIEAAMKQQQQVKGDQKKKKK